VVDFPAAQDRLEIASRGIPAFEVELAEFRTFHHRRGKHTIWLAPNPESELIQLHAVVWRAAVSEEPVGGRPPRFQPHLSVGQVHGKDEMLRLVAELQAAWQPVRFVVSDISLIWRGEPPDDVFQVAATVPLGSGSPP
jgi:2'-5' RNA ligase